MKRVFHNMILYTSHAMDTPPIDSGAWWVHFCDFVWLSPVFVLPKWKGKLNWICLTNSNSKYLYCLLYIVYRALHTIKENRELIQLDWHTHTNKDKTQIHKAAGTCRMAHLQVNSLTPGEHNRKWNFSYLCIKGCTMNVWDDYAHDECLGTPDRSGSGCGLVP